VTQEVTRIVVAGVLVLAVLYVLHRAAIWAENRGWIYYRKGHGRSWAAGAAAQELQSLLQPSSQHVVEESRRQELERDDAEDASDC
jgi:hypothetical protein